MNKFIEMEKEKEYWTHKLLQYGSWLDDLDDNVTYIKNRLNEIEENADDIDDVKKDIRDLNDWMWNFDIQDYTDGYDFDDFVTEDNVKDILEEEIQYAISKCDLSEIAGDNFINTITKEVIKRIWEVARNEILSKI